jgi:hypothetical protein
MGLDTTHGCWHGAYSAFHRWRSQLAEIAGLPPLEMMEGFWGAGSTGMELTLKCAANYCERTKNQHDADGLRALASRPAIKWSALKPSPLHILLHHSDCEGSIAAADCGPIADALEALIPLMPGDDAGGHIGNWRAKTQAFVDGLRVAAAAGEDVEFH